MALIVEDGSGLPDAESFGSVAEADAYHLAMGNAAWAPKTQEEKEVQLRRGTQYIIVKYGQRWKGCKLLSTQALDFPRYGVTDNDGFVLPSSPLPTALKRALFELALKGFTEELLPDVASPGMIKEKERQLGPLRTRTVYTSGASQIKYFHNVHSLLLSLIESSNRIYRS